jgi:gas vesicle protein
MVKFLIGLGCGVGLGLLIAPAAGEETREQLLEIARRPGDAARQKVQDVREDIAQMGANLGRQVAEKMTDKVIPDTLSPQSRRQG